MPPAVEMVLHMLVPTADRPHAAVWHHDGGSKRYCMHKRRFIAAFPVAACNCCCVPKVHRHWVLPVMSSEATGRGECA